MKNTLLTILFLTILNLGFSQQISQTYYFETPKILNVDDYQQIYFENTMQTASIGQPLLPYKSVKLLLPPNTNVSNIEFVYGPTVSIDLDKQIYPQQNIRPYSENSTPFVFSKNTDIYSNSTEFPENHNGKISTHYLHGHTIAMTTFTPVKYNPKDGTAKYYQWIKVVINTEKSKYQSNIVRHIERKDEVLNFIDNPSEIKYYNYTNSSRSEKYDALVITSNEFVSEFDKLIAENQKRGLITKVKSTEDISAEMTGVDLQEKIRNYIINEYQNSNIEFVTLGGDVEIVPSRGFYCYVQSGSGYEDYNIPSDLYYSALDGNWNSNNNNKWGEIDEDDLLPEVSVGRMSFSNINELNIMLNKSKKYIFEPVKSEHNKVLMAGEFLYNDPLSYGSDYLNLLIGTRTDNGYTTNGIPETRNIDSLYDKNSTWSGNQLIAKINEGYPMLFHSGHANEMYVMKLYINMITNSNFSAVNGTDHNFPLIYTHGCICGSFDSDDCIGEAMVKIDNFASVFIGNSRYGWFNEGQTEGPSAHINREFVSALYGNNIVNVGQAHKDSKTATAPWVNAPGQWEHGALRWCFYDCNVLGDPSMALYTNVPIDIQVNHPDYIPYNSTSIQVNVTSQNNKLSDVSCVLIQNGNIIGNAITNNSGNATINISEPLTGTQVSLFVSGVNITPKEYIIPISQLSTLPDLYDAKSNISVIPNPATSFINVKLNNFNNTKANYFIVDINGRKVAQANNIYFENNTATIDISELESGVYNIIIYADNFYGTQKIIKK